MKEIVALALEHTKIVRQVRFRSCVRLGRNRDSNSDGYFLSELVGQFSKQMRIGMDEIKTNMLIGRMGRSIIVGLKEHLKLKDALSVKIVSWPTVENIDLEELKTPLAYLSYDNRVSKIFHGMILEEQYN